jgi:class 3 adenylate cyclase
MSLLTDATGLDTVRVSPSDAQTDNLPLTAASQADKAADMLRAARLLVVDDSKMMRMGISRSLRQLGVEHIEEASNGRQALQRLQDETFDLMLLDVEMPEMTGLEVLAEMQHSPALRGFPVIVISGGQEIDDVVRCIEMGAEDYLPKPFSQVLLKARLTSSIEKKRLRDLETMRRQQLQAQHEQLALEQGKTERLLLNILPKSVSHRLKAGEKRIADAHPDVSVLFADLVGFTEMSKGMSAEKLVNLLDQIFSAFDAIAGDAEVEKIKTIGDCYMLVGGLPEPRLDHATAVVEVAFAMLAAIEVFNQEHGTRLQIRIGVNSGPVVAGVIGMHKFTYDLWGNTVNVASRMESTGTPGRVHVSPTTAQQLGQHFALQARGAVTVKGIGELETFFVLGRRTMDAPPRMEHLPLTPSQWPEGLHQACRQLRAQWPGHWPGLPHILALCQQSLGLDTAAENAIVSLNQFAQSVAQNMEQHAAGLEQASEPAYHNRLHTADVLCVLTTMLHILNVPGADAAGKTWASALLASAVAHDHQHPGGVNHSAQEFERASWYGVMPFAQHLPVFWREQIEGWILGTDVPAVPGNHQRIAEQSFTWSPAWAQVLLNEADIYISATAEFGPGLSDALAREWHRAGFAGHATVATPAGRAQFLRSVRFSSPAAQVLGIQVQVQQQLPSLTPQD